MLPGPSCQSLHSSIKSGKGRRILRGLCVGLLVVLVVVGLFLAWAFGYNSLLAWREEEAWKRWEQGKPATYPEGIHIAYGDDSSQILITWATGAPAEGMTASSGQPLAGEEYQTDPTISDSSYVWYAEATSQDEGNWTKTAAYDLRFTKLNDQGKQWLHKAKLTGLQVGTRYKYKVQTGDAVTPEMFFSTMKAGNSYPTKFLVYGDLGVYGGGPILPYLKAEVARGDINAIIHAGDFAYDLRDEGGKVGDRFMRQIEPLASTVPYMTCVGNHEIHANFTHYRNRFTMPNQDLTVNPANAPMYYSWDISNIHFVVYSTDSYDLDWPQQRAFLEQDLIYANAPENRTIRPWIIAVGHRPHYCSNWDEICDGVGAERAMFEEMFFAYGVDLVISGHMHSYERLYPVYRGKATSFDYNNPRSPAHVITGAAGCNEQFGWCLNMMVMPHGDWSAYRMWLPSTNSYSRMMAHNDTHLEWQQVMAYSGDVVDSMMLVQNHHGPFKPIHDIPRLAMPGTYSAYVNPFSATFLWLVILVFVVSDFIAHRTYGRIKRHQ